MTDVGQELARIKNSLAADAREWFTSGPVLRETFAVLRRHMPVVSVGGTVLVTRARDVREVIERNDVFTVAEITAARMERTTGEFILGMDDRARYDREANILRKAVREGDAERVRTLASAEANRIVRRASGAGRLDLVGELSRMVPLRIVEDYFGTGAVDDVTMMRWMRTIFWEIFLDFDSDPAVSASADASSREMHAHLDREIARRKADVGAGGTHKDDFLGRLLAMQSFPETALADDAIRRNIGGLIVGAVDTTSKAIAHAVDQLLDRPDALALARDAAEKENEPALRAILFEALRFNPMSPILVRHASVDYLLGSETPIPAGSRVFAATLSAMFDAEVVPEPDEFRADRAAGQYIHFGLGLHQCFGRFLNEATIPAIAAPLLKTSNLRRAPGMSGTMSNEGPFPDHLTVEFTPSARVEQRAFTAIHEIRRDAVADVEKYLNALGDDVAKQQDIPFANLTSLHFARWVILPARTQDSNPLLAFECNVDGEAAAFFEALARASGPAMERVYSACVGFKDWSANGGSIPAFITKCEVPTAAFHVAHRGKTVESILKEAALREALDRFLDADRRSGMPQTPLAIRARAFAHLRSIDLGPLPPPVPPLPQWEDPALWLADNKWTLGVAALLLAPVTLPIGLLVAVAYGWLRILEATDKVDPIVREPAHVQKVSRREDVQSQNQLTHVVAMKPGLFRQVVVRAVLFAIDVLARKRFNRGDLGGIPSIHFARWAFIDRGERLLFFSNYDGTWESYLGDFIDKAHQGLTAIWSNTVGFPQSASLVGAGALDEERFKTWTRRHQVATQLWYSAYPSLTNADIATNARIREGLDGQMTDAEATDWLNLFAGAVPLPLTQPRPAAAAPAPKNPPLETADIQSIVLSGHGDHLWSAFFAIRLGAPVVSAGWLDRVTQGVTSVDDRKQDVCRNIAFTAAGLRAIGLTAETIQTFADEFQEGMVTEDRARALGDDVAGTPPTLAWGGPGDSAVDALLLIYAKTEQLLEREIVSVRSAAVGGAVAIQWELKAEMLPARREHFGFVDGISQPSVRGLEDAVRRDPPAQLIAPGEFVFGYCNAYDMPPDAPTWKGDYGTQFNQLVRDGAFGRNGTYLVARQLYQDVAAFRRFSAAQGPSLYPTLGFTEAAKRLEAKIVGRWHDGTPLARAPNAPDPTQPDNDFGYDDDKQGFKCPVAAHVRRTNPRDSSLGPTPAEALRVVNRHRILRRGRSYGAFLEEGSTKDDERARGLVFMCVNTNIGRQFEFVQQTWSENRKFGGLSNDRDPLVGRQKQGVLTIPETPVRARALPMQTFVRLLGGDYFFVPGMRALRALVHLAGTQPGASATTRGAVTVPRTGRGVGMAEEWTEENDVPRRPIVTSGE